jgi:hypothetical protein
MNYYITFTWTRSRSSTAERFETWCGTPTLWTRRLDHQISLRTPKVDTTFYFSRCHVSNWVPQKLRNETSTKLTLFRDVSNHFTLFGELIKGNNNKKFRHIIWMTITWSILRKRNNILFKREFVNIYFNL